MSVRKEASGRRSVQSEVELPGTLEEVWQTIATGPGISSWFVPTETEQGADGRPARMVMHMGPGMDAAATITAWEPPRRFTAESAGWTPGMPPLMTEWTVEARSGGTCLVRVVHSLFASTDDWDSQLEGTETGWPVYFRILRAYLMHFRGQPCSNIQVMAMATVPDPRSAWTALTGSLGLEGARVGDRRSAPTGAPQLMGAVEALSESKNERSMLMRLDKPAAGVVSVGAFPCGGATMVSVCIYLYGGGAAATAAREEPLWQAWMSKQFPAASNASA